MIPGLRNKMSTEIFPVILVLIHYLAYFGKINTTDNTSDKDNNTLLKPKP